MRGSTEMPVSVAFMVGAFTRRPTPATAIALEHAGAWQLRQNAVMDLARREPDLAQRMIESMASRPTGPTR